MVVNLYCDDQATLHDLAPKIADALTDGVKDLDDVETSVTPAGDALDVQVDRVKASLEGVDPDALTKDLIGAAQRDGDDAGAGWAENGRCAGLDSEELFQIQGRSGGPESAGARWASVSAEAGGEFQGDRGAAGNHAGQPQAICVRSGENQGIGSPGGPRDRGRGSEKGAGPAGHDPAGRAIYAGGHVRAAADRFRGTECG